MINVRAASILLSLINSIFINSDDVEVHYACHIIETRIIALLEETFPGENAVRLINDYRKTIKEESNA